MMGLQHIALAVAVMASLFTPAEPANAFALGELQAVASNHPPYIFRLALVPSPGSLSDIPAVTVRQPQDALSFVRNNLLELRLRSLTDVELEVSQGGQTLNRLLLKGELQAARARLEAATAANRYQPAKAKGHETPSVEGKPLTPPTDEASVRALLEREVQGIRREIQNLVGQVRPWEGLSTPAWPTEERVAMPVFTLTLWGVFIAGVASLVTGYMMQRSAVTRQQQRRRALPASIRRPRGELLSGVPILYTVQRTQRLGDQSATSEPVTVMRRVRVSRTTRRRIRVRAPSAAYDATHTRAAEQTRGVARISHARTPAPAEVVEVLGHLRRELTRLQRMLPTSESPTSHRHPV